jgi:hypothetical protein
MRTSTRVLGIIVLFLGLLAISNGIKGQQVIRKGKTFIEIPKNDSTSRGVAHKTEYYYIDANGVFDTIWVSSKGSAFIWKVSKKTGKKYRKYLPEITKSLKK